MSSSLKLLSLILAIYVLNIEGNVVRNVGVASAATRVGMFNRYIVHNRQNFFNGVTITAANIPDTITNLDTVVVVHGLSGSATSSLSIPIKDAILQTNDYNVIVVDWSVFASEFSLASTAVPSIAENLAELLTAYLTATTSTADTLHLVGFGLGAHVVGIVGRTLGNVGKITGLDPAGNGWETNPNRLASTDALFVEVIHTDGFGTRANGISEPLGHIDFYPNGGRTNQPGCSNNLCSHTRSWELFESTILNENRLQGSRCNSLADMTSNRCTGPVITMGWKPIDQYASGIYRLTTARAYPY